MIPSLYFLNLFHSLPRFPLNCYYFLSTSPQAMGGHFHGALPLSSLARSVDPWRFNFYLSILRLKDYFDVYDSRFFHFCPSKLCMKNRYMTYLEYIQTLKSDKLKYHRIFIVTLHDYACSLYRLCSKVDDITEKLGSAESPHVYSLVCALHAFNILFWSAQMKIGAICAEHSLCPLPVLILFLILGTKWQYWCLIEPGGK